MIALLAATLLLGAPAATVADKPLTVKVRVDVDKPLFLRLGGVRFTQPVLLKISAGGADLGMLSAGERYADGGWPSINTNLELKARPKKGSELTVTLTPVPIDSDAKIPAGPTVTIESITPAK